jgi:hypothetical protein
METLELIIVVIVFLVFGILLIILIDKNMLSQFKEEFYGSTYTIQRQNWDSIIIYNQDVYPIRDFTKKDNSSVLVYVCLNGTPTVGYYDFTDSTWIVSTVSFRNLEKNETLTWIYPPKQMKNDKS